MKTLSLPVFETRNNRNSIVENLKFINDSNSLSDQIHSKIEIINSIYEKNFIVFDGTSIIRPKTKPNIDQEFLNKRNLNKKISRNSIPNRSKRDLRITTSRKLNNSQKMPTYLRKKSPLASIDRHLEENAQYYHKSIINKLQINQKRINKLKFGSDIESEKSKTETDIFHKTTINDKNKISPHSRNEIRLNKIMLFNKVQAIDEFNKKSRENLISEYNSFKKIISDFSCDSFGNKISNNTKDAVSIMLKDEIPKMKFIVGSVAGSKNQASILSEKKACLVKAGDAISKMNENNCYNFKKMIEDKYQENSDKLETIDDCYKKFILKNIPKKDRLSKNNHEMHMIQTRMSIIKRRILDK